MKPEPFIPGMGKEMQAETGHTLAHALRDLAPHMLSEKAVEDSSPEGISSMKELCTLRLEEKMLPFVEAFVAEPLPRIDPETIRREAFAEGEEKKRMEMQEEFSARISEIRDKHAAEIDNLYKNTFRDITTQFEAGLQSGLEKMEIDLLQRVSEILADFVCGQLKEEAVRLFSKRVIAEYSDAVRPLTIEGNSELIALFQSHAGVDLSQYRLRPADDREIRVVMGTSVLSTRIAPLLEELKEQIS